MVTQSIKPGQQALPVRSSLPYFSYSSSLSLGQALDLVWPKEIDRAGQR